MAGKKYEKNTTLSENAWTLANRYIVSLWQLFVFFFRECAQYEKCNEPPNKKDNNSTYERVKQVENEWDFKMNVTKIVYIMEVLSIERDNR